MGRLGGGGGWRGIGVTDVAVEESEIFQFRTVRPYQPKISISNPIYFWRVLCYS
ncbi:hypothetical protein HMPREF0240_00502 [Clostridium sp. D5]|nr:hypothetical protein HMPREF0240_00502 [Clostridium sp. D5]